MGFKLLWLWTYNVIQFFGWSYLGALITKHVLDTKTSTGVYDEISKTLVVFQTLAILEIVHVAIKLVRSNPLFTFMQVFSRLYVLWGVLIPIEESRNSTGVIMLLSAWTVTEVVRYAFYAFELLKLTPYWLLWSRYSLFVVLYPLGGAGEVYTMYDTAFMFFAGSVKGYYNYGYVLCFMGLTYAYNFGKLYFHMFSQRKKSLNKSSSLKAE